MNCFIYQKIAVRSAGFFYCSILRLGLPAKGWTRKYEELTNQQMGYQQSSNEGHLNKYTVSV